MIRRPLLAVLVLALGLAPGGCRSRRDGAAPEHRAEARLHEAELRAAAAHARASLFDCGTRYREATEWGAYCRQALREVAEAERLAGN